MRCNEVRGSLRVEWCQRRTSLADNSLWLTYLVSTLKASNPLMSVNKVEKTCHKKSDTIYLLIQTCICIYHYKNHTQWFNAFDVRIYVVPLLAPVLELSLEILQKGLLHLWPTAILNLRLKIPSYRLSRFWSAW